MLPRSARISAARRVWRDGRDRRVVARLQPAIYRWHWKRYDRDGEAFWYQQLLMNLPARSLQDFCRPDSDSYRHECFRRGLVKDNTQMQLMERLAIERHFDPRYVAKMMAELRAFERGGNVETALPGGYGNEHIPDGPDYAHRCFAVPDESDQDQADIRAILGLDSLLEKSRFKYPHSLSVSQLTPSQKRAHFHICTTILRDKQQGLFFITGAGGTGKSDLLRSLVSTLQHASQDVAVTATSGAAACLLQGQTVHSFFGLLKDLTFLRAIRSNIAMQLRRLDTVFIDEVSMMPASWLNAVDQVLRQARDCAKPFGGVNVVLVGDFYQLPAVVERVPPSLTGGSDIGTTSIDDQLYHHALFSSFKPLFLLENCRQAKDPSYSQLLNRLRVGILTAEDHGKLLSRTVPFEDALQHARATGSLVLAARNVVVDHVNREFLRNVASDAVALDAVDRYLAHSGRFADEPATSTDSVMRSFNGHWKLNKLSASPDRLELKLGAHVMLTRNIATEQGMVNGMRGIVTAIDTQSNIISVRRLDPARNSTDNIVYIPKYTEHHQILQSGRPAVDVTRTQYPLRVCYAATVHKAQGAYLDRVVIVLDDMINSGQLYTALSRCKLFQNIVLTWFDPEKAMAGIVPYVKPVVDTIMTRALQQSTAMAAPPSDYDGSTKCFAVAAAFVAAAAAHLAPGQSSSNKPAGSRGPSAQAGSHAPPPPAQPQPTQPSSAQPQRPQQHTAPVLHVPHYVARKSYPCLPWALNGCGPDSVLELVYHALYLRYPRLFDRPGLSSWRQVLNLRHLYVLPALPGHADPMCAPRVAMYKLMRLLHGRYSQFFAREFFDGDLNALPVLGSFVDIHETSQLIWGACEADLSRLQDDVRSAINNSEAKGERRLDIVPGFGLVFLDRCASQRCAMAAECTVRECDVKCHHFHHTRPVLSLAAVCFDRLQLAVGGPRRIDVDNDAKQTDKSQCCKLPINAGSYMPLAGLLSLQDAVNAELQKRPDTRCLHAQPIIRCGERMNRTMKEPGLDVCTLHFAVFGGLFGSCAQALDPRSLSAFSIGNRRYSLAGLVYYLPGHFTAEFVIRVGVDEFYYYDGMRNGGRAVQVGAAPQLKDAYSGENLRARVILMFYVANPAWL